MYAFGITLFEVVAREYPFQGLSQPELLGKLNARFDPSSKGVKRMVRPRQHHVFPV